MFEANINVIVNQTNDQLNILKAYIQYRVTFHVKRVLNRLHVRDSLGWSSGRIEFSDCAPLAFDVLTTAYHDGLKKDSVIKAVQMTVTELDQDIACIIK